VKRSDVVKREELGHSRLIAWLFYGLVGVIALVQGSSAGFSAVWWGVAAGYVAFAAVFGWWLRRIGVWAQSDALVIGNPFRRHVVPWATIDRLDPPEPKLGLLYVVLNDGSRIRIAQGPAPWTQSRARLYELVAERTGSGSPRE
jgi:hypothetical protein